jgi:hypothetical protein
MARDAVALVPGDVIQTITTYGRCTFAVFLVGGRGGKNLVMLRIECSCRNPECDSWLKEFRASVSEMQSLEWLVLRQQEQGYEWETI